VGINKDRHARIIIVRPEITLHLEAGYIFAGCSRRNRFFLQFGGGPYMLRQLMSRDCDALNSAHQILAFRFAQPSAKAGGAGIVTASASEE